MIALALRYWHFVVIAALVALLGLSQVKLSAEKEAHANTRVGHAEVLRDLAEKTLKAYQAVVADDEARKKAAAALDAKHTKELNDEKTKLEKLRADVAAGRVGLRVNATCTSAAGTDVPPAASPPAWLMQPAPDLPTPLNGIISPYEPGLKPPASR